MIFYYHINVRKYEFNVVISNFILQEVQILKAVILGEEERGQSHYQVMCFVCHYQKGEFISSAAIAKLRQKNPGIILHLLRALAIKIIKK